MVKRSVQVLAAMVGVVSIAVGEYNEDWSDAQADMYGDMGNGAEFSPEADPIIHSPSYNFVLSNREGFADYYDEFLVGDGAVLNYVNPEGWPQPWGYKKQDSEKAYFIKPQSVDIKGVIAAEVVYSEYQPEDYEGFMRDWDDYYLFPAPMFWEIVRYRNIGNSPVVVTFSVGAIYPQQLIGYFEDIKPADASSLIANGKAGGFSNLKEFLDLHIAGLREPHHVPVDIDGNPVNPPAEYNGRLPGRTLLIPSSVAKDETNGNVNVFFKEHDSVHEFGANGLYGADFYQLFSGFFSTNHDNSKRSGLFSNADFSHTRGGVLVKMLNPGDSVDVSQFQVNAVTQSNYMFTDEPILAGTKTPQTWAYRHVLSAVEYFKVEAPTNYVEYTGSTGENVTISAAVNYVASPMDTVILQPQVQGFQRKGFVKSSDTSNDVSEHAGNDIYYDGNNGLALTPRTIEVGSIQFSGDYNGDGEIVTAEIITGNVSGGEASASFAMPLNWLPGRGYAFTPAYSTTDDNDKSIEMVPSDSPGTIHVLPNVPLKVTLNPPSSLDVDGDDTPELIQGRGGFADSWEMDITVDRSLDDAYIPDFNVDGEIVIVRELAYRRSYKFADADAGPKRYFEVMAPGSDEWVAVAPDRFTDGEWVKDALDDEVKGPIDGVAIGAMKWDDAQRKDLFADVLTETGDYKVRAVIVPIAYFDNAEGDDWGERNMDTAVWEAAPIYSEVFTVNITTRAAPQFAEIGGTEPLTADVQGVVQLSQNNGAVITPDVPFVLSQPTDADEVTVGLRIRDADGDLTKMTLKRGHLTSGSIDIDGAGYTDFADVSIDISAMVQYGALNEFTVTLMDAEGQRSVGKFSFHAYTGDSIKVTTFRAQEVPYDRLLIILNATVPPGAKLNSGYSRINATNMHESSDYAYIHSVWCDDLNLLDIIQNNGGIVSSLNLPDGMTIGDRKPQVEAAVQNPTDEPLRWWQNSQLSNGAGIKYRSSSGEIANNLTAKDYLTVESATEAFSASYANNEFRIPTDGWVKHTTVNVSDKEKTAKTTD